jgi:hypothetical protein
MASFVGEIIGAHIGPVQDAFKVLCGHIEVLWTARGVFAVYDAIAIIVYPIAARGISEWAFFYTLWRPAFLSHEKHAGEQDDSNPDRNKASSKHNCTPLRWADLERSNTSSIYRKGMLTLPSCRKRLSWYKGAVTMDGHAPWTE